MLISCFLGGSAEAHLHHRAKVSQAKTRNKRVFDRLHGGPIARKRTGRPRPSRGPKVPQLRLYWRALLPVQNRPEHPPRGRVNRKGLRLHHRKDDNRGLTEIASAGRAVLTRIQFSRLHSTQR